MDEGGGWLPLTGNGKDGWLFLDQVAVKEIFDYEDRSEQAGHILIHRGQDAIQGVEAEVIQYALAGDFPIFVDDADDQRTGDQDRVGNFFAYMQFDRGQRVEAGGQEKAHAEMGREMNDLIMVRQRIREYETETDYTGSEQEKYDLIL